MSGVQNVLRPHAGLTATTAPSLWALCTLSYRGPRTPVHRKPTLASCPPSFNVQPHATPHSGLFSTMLSTLSFQEPASSFISGLTIAVLLIFLLCLEKNALILKTLTTRMFLVTVMAPVRWISLFALQPHSSPISSTAPLASSPVWLE